MLAVQARAPEAPALTDAEDVLPTEGVVEEAGVVAARRSRPAFVPVNAVRRGVDQALVACRMAPEDEHLEAFGRFGVGVEPDQRAVAPPVRRMLDNRVGAAHHFQGRSLPVEAVAAGGESCAVEPAGVIPELEGVVGRVEPNAVVERCGDRAVAAVQLQNGLRARERARTHGLWRRGRRGGAWCIRSGSRPRRAVGPRRLGSRAADWPDTARAVGRHRVRCCWAATRRGVGCRCRAWTWSLEAAGQRCVGHRSAAKRRRTFAVTRETVLS